MDYNAISSYNLHLAQISTGQRESECLPVQTTDLIPQSDILPGLPPSYNSYPPAIGWAQSRSVLGSRSAPESQSMESHQLLGYSNPWGATISGSGEQQYSLTDRTRGSQPEIMTYAYQSPCSTLPMASPSLINQFSPRVVKSDPDMPFQQGYQSTPMWTNHENFNYHSIELEHMKLEDPDGITLSTPITPPSPISITSHHSSSYSSHSSTGVHSNSISIMVDRSSPRTSSRDSEEDHPADPPSTDPPYSQLIYQALKETKGHRLQLQDIYTWFEKNTNKGKDESKGWQNSIRHNLSMNAGFEAIKTDVPGGKKAVNYWSLTTQAISKGRVESTTRYRRPNPKKSSSSDNTAPLSTNQRGSAKVQKSWDESRQAKRQKHHSTPQSPSQQLGYALGGAPEPPCQIPVSTGSQQIYPYAFDYDKVVACTPLQENSPMFCDSVDPAPSWGPGPVRMDNYEWYSGPNNGALTGSEDQVTTDMHGHVKEDRWG